MFVPRRPSTSRPTHIVMHADHADPELRPQRNPVLLVVPNESRDCYIRSPAGTRCGECAGCKRYLADHALSPLNEMIAAQHPPKPERIRVDVHPRDLETVATVARQAVRTFAQTTLFSLEPTLNYDMHNHAMAVARGTASSPEELHISDDDFGGKGFAGLPVAVQSQYYLAFTTITCLLTATALMREAGPHG